MIYDIYDYTLYLIAFYSVRDLFRYEFVDKNTGDS